MAFELTEDGTDRPKPEAIVSTLRQVDVLVSRGQSVAASLGGIGVKAALAHLKPGGSVIVTSSVNSRHPTPSLLAYNAHERARHGTEWMDLGIADGVAVVTGAKSGMVGWRRSRST